MSVDRVSLQWKTTATIYDLERTGFLLETVHRPVRRLEEDEHGVYGKFMGNEH